MFSKLWNKTKEIAARHTKIFIVVMFLNQLLFFGLCLNPICLVAAMPHVLFITVIIGMFWDNISGKSKAETDLLDIRKSLDQLSDTRQGDLVNVPPENMAVLMGVDHYRYLLDSIRKADTRLIIMSGWLSKHVIDETLIRLISRRLRQGLEIYIGYGYQDSKGNHQELEGSEKVMRAIWKLADKYPDHFFVASFATHEKLLIIDDRIVVIGSANWLSNRKYKNSERSVIIADVKFAKSEGTRAVTEVMKHHIPL